MDPNPYVASASSLETPTPGTVSMVRYGLLCFVTLWVTILGYLLVSRLTGVRMGQWAGILCLLASVQFSSWRCVRTHRRVMSRLELQRFALACAVAYWVFDEGPALIRRWMSPDDHLLFRVLIASAVDLAIAAAIVYVTVPPIARHFAASMLDSARRSQHPG
jgi:hypothetical protein